MGRISTCGCSTGQISPLRQVLRFYEYELTQCPKFPTSHLRWVHFVDLPDPGELNPPRIAMLSSCRVVGHERHQAKFFVPPLLPSHRILRTGSLHTHSWQHPLCYYSTTHTVNLHVLHNSALLFLISILLPSLRSRLTTASERSSTADY